MWTRAEAALRLGVSQPYYSQLESGFRPVREEVVLTAVRVLLLSPAALPLPGLDSHFGPLDPRELAAQVAWLGYAGFAHRKRASRPMKQSVTMAAALAHADRDVPIFWALPWALSAFHYLDWDWLSTQCRLGNQQNRLAYLAWVARKPGRPEAAGALDNAVSSLERSRLALEGTLCSASMSPAERARVRKHRPREATHWELLTTLTAGQLTHAA